MKISVKTGVIILSTIIICFLGYRIYNPSSHKVSTSFYYWKSEFQLNESDVAKLKACNSERIYLHLFDVDVESSNSEPIPRAKLKFNEAFPAGLSIVPVIYITNKTFEDSSPSSLEILAKRIIQLSKEITQPLNTEWSEYQIDCDWTVKTKERYFKFLQLIRKELDANIPLSATIRLHQIKYPKKTGIPPIDRGMLMFYNMGNVSRFSKINTIYNERLAANYLGKLKEYPIKLDYALPAFSWGLHYRLEAIKSILSDQQMLIIQKSDAFTTNDHISYCIKDGFSAGTYFQKGDVIKFEQVDKELCTKAANQLAKHINSSTFQVVFYHLGSEEIQNYEPSQLKDISAIFN